MGSLDKLEFGWLALPEHGGDVVVKPAAYLPIYEELLAGYRDKAFTLLELGVWTGHSLEMWRNAFPSATIVGVDINPPDIDLGDRVHLVTGDQSDAVLMDDLRQRYAPKGFEVIIDDASHFGALTAQSLQALYVKHLQSGGLYMIEDWATGYMADWHDGGDVTERIDVDTLDCSLPVGQANSFASHSIGMVGIIKRLIDHCAAGSISALNATAIGKALPIERMIVKDGVVTLVKP